MSDIHIDATFRFDADTPVMETVPVRAFGRSIDVPLYVLRDGKWVPGTPVNDEMAWATTNPINLPPDPGGDQ